MSVASAVIDAPAALERSYEQAELEALLPHRGCMLMLRRLCVHGPHAFTGEAFWPVDDPFVLAHGSSSLVPATLLVEAAAQAAGAGLLAVDEDPGMLTRLGLLAGLRRCSFDQPAHAGRPVQYSVTTRRLSTSLAHAAVEVVQDGSRLASLQLLLAMPEG